MLKIGEFVALTGISIHMLRHYDKIGLLIPAYVEEASNYRYYSEDQIILANRIQILKELGFGLKEISKIGNSSEKDLHGFIEKKILEKIEEKKRIEDQIKGMEQRISHLERYREWIFSVKIAALAPRRIVSLRANLEKFEEEGLLWEKLEQTCVMNDIKVLSSEYSYAITHSVDFENGIIDTEVQRAVSSIPKKCTGLNYYELPAIETAMVSAKGAYNRIGDISSYVYEYIQGTNYEICDAPLRRYIISPNEKEDPTEYITEYYYPLKTI